MSDKEWTDLAGQIEDALQFLESFRDDLRALVATAGVQRVWLDCPFASRASENPPLPQSVFLPPSLLALAGELGVGIEVSVYPPIFEVLTRANPPLQPTSGAGQPADLERLRRAARG